MAAAEYGSQEYNDDGRTFTGSGAPCTLDGRRAVIVGRSCDFATVATLPTGPAYQYAWSTIARVMRAGGSFKS